MRFGGIRKTSLIDYPERVSCVAFASGCNFRCPFCHNPDLATGRAYRDAFEEKDLYAFLNRRKGLLDGVVLSGGEPTIQEDLPEVCRQVKALGFSVKLDTNGSRPRVLEALLEQGLVDYVAMDIKTDPHRYGPLLWPKAEAEALHESIRLIMQSSIPYEFRTTCVKPFVDEPVVDRISLLIQGARRYALQHFQPENLLDPGFFRHMSPGFDDRSMARLMAVAAPRVQSCIVR